MYTIPHFVADDCTSLPAYSPPGDRSHFTGTFKTLSKEEVDDLHLSKLSLDKVTIPTIRSGELSPITPSEASFSSDDAEPSTPYMIQLPSRPPSTSIPTTLESPPQGRFTGLPPPPRACTHASRFSVGSDIGDMA